MYSASEKLAIIRLVEDSELPIRRTLTEINDFICTGFTNGIAGQTSFAGLQKVLAPAVIEIIVYPFPTA